jgi:hypothetical protein
MSVDFTREREAVPTRQRPGPETIDRPAVSLASRSCCCPSRPAVIVLMPPAKGRRHATDLLLCGHHYRVSRRALATAGARVTDLDGMPVTSDWPSC